MRPVWAQRREELWSDCLVSPDVFHEMVNRLGEFVMPYQQALETEADPHSMHLYLQGLLSQLPRKNAEAIAAPSRSPPRSAIRHSRLASSLRDIVDRGRRWILSLFHRERRASSRPSPSTPRKCFHDTEEERQ